MKRLNIYLDGPALAGRSETMRRIGERMVPPRRWDHGDALSLIDETDRMQVELRTRVQPTLWYDLVDDADKDPAYAVQRDFIASIDVLMLVVDSQRERLDMGVRCFEQLRGALRRLGRDPDQVPVVFQLNKRDLPNVAAEAELRTLFQSPRSAYVATIASRGKGIDGVVGAAIELGGAVSLSDRRGHPG